MVSVERLAVLLCMAAVTSCALGQLKGPGYDKPRGTWVSWTTVRDRAMRLFARPAMVDDRGRVLATTAVVNLDDGIPLFAPWYLGDSAGRAAVHFCSLVTEGLGASTPLHECIEAIENDLIARVHRVADMVISMADAHPSLQPGKIPEVGLFEGMEGLLPNLGDVKWRPDVYKWKKERDAAQVAAAASVVDHAADGSCSPLMDGTQHVFDSFAATTATKEMHCYSWMYAELLGRYACMGSEAHAAAGGKQMRILEIGFDRGDSALLWRSIFPSADMHSIDNGVFVHSWAASVDVITRNAAAAGITLHNGDQADAAFLEAVAARAEATNGEPGFDLILDDGGHSMRQQQTSLATLWKHVRPGGMLVIEDLETSYYTREQWRWFPPNESQNGGPPGTPGTTVEYIKKLIDVLNKKFHGGEGFSLFPDDGSVASFQ